MKERFKILCVGVNKVPWFKELNYAERDADTLAKYVETLKEEADVTLLTAKNATREKILAWVKECSAIQEELTVILFFAGHGSAEKNDKTKNLERCLWIDGNPNPNHDSHQLYTSEILKGLDNPHHQLILLIDACYDFDPKLKVSIRTIFKQFKESERMTALKQYAIISASAVNKAALEDPQLGHGVLTYYFLQAMAGTYTFFLRKKIAFFKFLAILDKKVRNHCFLTDTGRKVTHKMLRENGIMVHWHGTNFDLPVLEPRPLIQDPGKNAFQQKRSQWIYFFTRTRLRTKMSLMTGLLTAALLLLYLVQTVVVRVQFKPLYYPMYYNSLSGSPGLPLYGLKIENLGQDRNKKINLFLFKPNWIKALLRKLDGKGKIILKGYLLGDRFNGISELQAIGFALGDNEGVFYWNPYEVMKTLKLLRWGYLFLNGDDKKVALKLLGKLGTNGKTTAKRIFDFKRERDQELRNVFLEYFYSNDSWEKNVDYFNQDDYLGLIRNPKEAPFSKNPRLRQKLERFLRTVARDVPDSNIRINDTDKLSEIYEKLSILAFFASPDFRTKAAHIFKRSFDPEKVLHLLLTSGNFSNRVWLLEQYFLHMKDIDIPDEHWWKLTDDLFEKLPVKERSKILKIFIDTRFLLIPEGFKSHLFRLLEDADPTIIGLSDWENWLKKYRVSPFDILFSITKMKHPRIFQLIERNYDYFKEEFSFYQFEILYKIDPQKTLRLAKKIYPLSSPQYKLYCAVFLVNKNYREYSPYIVDFLREARNDRQKRDILERFYGVEALIPIVEANRNLQEELRYLLNDRKLFYWFVIFNMHFWPKEVNKILLDSKIPHGFNEGISLLRACEKLPHPFRKQMLVKIGEADIDDTFRLNTDISLIEHYPAEFLKLAYKRGYHQDQLKRGYVVRAYEAFSYEALRYELTLNLKTGQYRRIEFICEAFVNNVSRGKWNIEQLQAILKEFNRPEERIALRTLRHYVHKRYFQDGEKHE